MISEDYSEIICDGEGCQKRINNNSWTRIKSNWFFTKEGKTYCPDCTPEWVQHWRNQRKAKR